MPINTYQNCIEACNACAEACDSCAAACLNEPDAALLERCIALDADCAQLCRTTAGFLARGGEFAHALCKLCAELCESCGLEGIRHQHRHCRDCAAACERAAQACRDVLGAQAGADTISAGAGLHPTQAANQYLSIS